MLIINKLNLNDSSNGYNITIGGDGRTGIRNINCHKKVYQYSLNGYFIKEWECGMDIERALGFDAGNINACCNGKNHTSCGYLWSFKKYNKITEYIDNRSVMLNIRQYDLKGNFIRLYTDFSDINICYPEYKAANIYSCCKENSKSAYGFIWSLEDLVDKIKDIIVDINTRVKINQLDEFGHVINTYVSYKDAETQTEVNKEKIRYHVKTKRFDKTNKCYWFKDNDAHQPNNKVINN